MDIMIQFAYIVSAALFIYGLKQLGSPATARRGNSISALGMLVAVVAALLDQGIVDFQWIVLGFVVGGAIGGAAARMVQMTSMPEMVALFNGFGGIASLLVGWAVYQVNPDLTTYQTVTIMLSVFIGSVTFAGSFIAFAMVV